MTSPFVMFGASHLITLVLVAILSAGLFRAGQSGRAALLNSAGGSLFALLAVGLWLFRLSNGFQAKDDLPLSLCDIAFLLCVACFFWPNDLMLTLVAYWGLAGTLQAMITPDVFEGFPSREFLLFFVGHSVIVLCVFFLLGKNRPPRLAGPHGVAVAFSGLLGYTAVVGLLDAVFGWNYGYLRAKPYGASILDKMGPWPIYVGAGLALALVLFVGVAGLLRVLWKLFPDGERQR